MRPLYLASSVAAVAGLAISQPVLGVLGDNPEFFIARARPRTDAYLVAVLVGIAVPLAVAAATFFVARLRPRAGWMLHAVLFGGLTGWTAVQMADAVGAGLVVSAGTGLVAAAGAIVGYRRVESLRWILRFGAVIPLVVVGSFVLASPSSAVLSGGGADIDVDVTVTESVPVVIIVLDELPTVSLLEDLDTINATRFPNIAGLAADGVWYRRATTVAARSQHAVPAILSGRYPQQGWVPSYVDWPVNVLTMLADSHEILAREPITGLCPPTVCDEPPPVPVGEVSPAGLWGLVNDVRLVALHVTLPQALTEGLPAINENWGNFAGQESADDGDVPDFDERVISAERERFVGLSTEAGAEIRAGRLDDFEGWVQPPGELPHLYVLHTLMPHKPWEYLPSGHRVADEIRFGVEDGVMVDDDFRRLFDDRLHLFQAGATDLMVGGLLDDLRAADQYDDALIVLVADHGQANVVGENDREPKDDNVPWIVDVPLIIKYPDGPRGLIDDRPAMIVDIVPTIADVLGVGDPPAFDGVSLLGPPVEDRERFFVTGSGPTPFAWDPEGLERALAQRLEDYGPDPSWQPVWNNGPYQQLLGQQVGDVRTGSFLVSIDREELLAEVPGPRGIVPSLVSGGAAFPEPGYDELPWLAIALNGRIAAIGRVADRTQEDGGPFRALIPPEAFEPTGNELEILVIVEEADGTIVLHSAVNR